MKAVSSGDSRDSEDARRKISLARFALWSFVSCTLLVVPGCGGCRSQTPAEIEAQKQAVAKAKENEEKARKERDKPRLEVGRSLLLPSTFISTGYKPGHWTGFLAVDAKDNKDDFQGLLETEIEDAQSHPAPLIGVPYELKNTRPAILPKEQLKSLEAFAWIPAVPGVRFTYRLTSGLATGAEYGNSLPLRPMPSYEYHFVVLARLPGHYDYLDKNLDSIRWKRDIGLGDSPSNVVNYEVVRMPPQGRPMLATRALYWTTIAYLLWDDYDPSQLDLDQQQAMLDWLHWGGQLIVSGPDSLDVLRTSFLGPYLPATAAGTCTFSQSDLDELRPWSGEMNRPPRVLKPWTGIRLQSEPYARPIPDKKCKLLVERSVGRGRIVVSAFRLSGQELVRWPGFDSLFNACLLRRPPRRFVIADANEGTLDVRWTDAKRFQVSQDAAANSQVRFFARDEGLAFGKYASDVVKVTPTVLEGFSPPDTIVDEPDDESRQRIAPGVAAWNDFSPVAQAARTSLVGAAGIRVPDRSFIVWVIVVYLVVLVPLNWFLFRMIGRVEWAWIAAPLIAIGCTMLVIHLAELNIGFARSQNEIAVVEMQAGYPRAHLTRYTALYTSLSTDYELELTDPGGQVLPFPLVDSPDAFEMPAWQTRRKLVCSRGESTHLSGVGLASNSIGFVHSEEFTDLKGAVSMVSGADGELKVTNSTPLLLEDVRVIRKNDRNKLETAKLARLSPAASEPIDFIEEVSAPSDKTNDEGSPASAPASGELSLGAIQAIACRGEGLLKGQTRLVAIVDRGVPGLSVAPMAQQRRQVTLLVAHLDSKIEEAPEVDANLRQDIVKRIEAEPGIEAKSE